MKIFVFALLAVLAITWQASSMANQKVYQNVKVVSLFMPKLTVTPCTRLSAIYNIKNRKFDVIF